MKERGEEEKKECIPIQVKKKFRFDSIPFGNLINLPLVH